MSHIIKIYTVCKFRYFRYICKYICIVFSSLVLKELKVSLSGEIKMLNFRNILCLVNLPQHFYGKSVFPDWDKHSTKRKCRKCAVVIKTYKRLTHLRKGILLK